MASKGERNSGLVMLVGAVVAAAAWAGSLMLVKEYDVVHNPRIYRLLGFPLAGAVIVALFGLAKLVLGRSLAEIGQGWDDLKGWQRGLLGTFIVGIAVAMIITVVGLAIAVMM